jgi:hypothetical protein
MISRIAASVIVVVAIGAIPIANDTAARSGGGFAAPSHPALRPAGIRPFFHSGRGLVGSRAAAVRSHEFRRRFLRHRRFVWPGVWSDGSGYEPNYPYYPYYDPTGQGAPYDAPAASPTAGYPTASSAPAERFIYVSPYRPGCDSQTQKLPWRDGGERSITIVRC